MCCCCLIRAPEPPFEALEVSTTPLSIGSPAQPPPATAEERNTDKPKEPPITQVRPSTFVIFTLSELKFKNPWTWSSFPLWHYFCASILQAWCHGIWYLVWIEFLPVQPSQSMLAAGNFATYNPIYLPPYYCTHEINLLCSLQTRWRPNELVGSAADYSSYPQGCH